MLSNVRRMLNERRAKEAMAVVGLTLHRTIAGLDMPERAAVMIMAHAMMRDAATEFGEMLISRPTKMPKPMVAEFISRLGAAHKKLTMSLEAVSDHAAGDIVYLGVLRQMRATEVVIVTIGCALDTGLAQSVRLVWGTLWAARGNAVDGVRLIKHFEHAVQERALPATQPRDPERMAKLATTLPPLFRQSAAPAKRAPR